MIAVRLAILYGSLCDWAIKKQNCPKKECSKNENAKMDDWRYKWDRE